MRKALKNAPHFEPQSLPLSIDLQARGVFFAYYALGNCWDFLRRYYYPTDCPDYLTLAIEAVSLAHLWHQVYSDAALATARARYVLALRLTNKSLDPSKKTTTDTVLLTSLLLDLFEKITDSASRNNKSWTSHLRGALALVRLRGLEQFQTLTELRVLVRLSSHYIISCVASDSSVPDDMIAIRNYVEKCLNFKEPVLRLSNLMIQYADARCKFRRGILSDDEYIKISMELDLKSQAIALDMPPSWQYSTTLLDRKSNRNFDLHFDSYPHRNICQAWNILRLIRILLNESLIEHYLLSPMDSKYLPLINVAHENIETLAREICASVPQYLDCDGPARQRLATPKMLELPDQTQVRILDHGHKGLSHPHTPSHQADCYTIIFPLYAAGRSKAVSNIRLWAIEQLHYISNHFGIRHAEVVTQILERQIDVSSWKVYAMLGSYAFLA